MKQNKSTLITKINKKQLTFNVVPFYFIIVSEHVGPCVDHFITLRCRNAAMKLFYKYTKRIETMVIEMNQKVMYNALLILKNEELFRLGKSVIPVSSHVI